MSTTIEPPNSIWPNGLQTDSEGYVNFYPLGINKINISTVTWPEGNKVISPFVYQDNELVGFIDTKSLEATYDTEVIINYPVFKAELSSALPLVKKGPDCEEFEVKYIQDTVPELKTSDLSDENLTFIRSAIFIDNNILYDSSQTAVGALDTTHIDNGYNMFYESKLASFSSDLSNLTNGERMFCYCTSLASFSSDLNNLTNSYEMFLGASLESFSGDLSSLVDGSSMFFNSPLESFSGDLSSLTNGYHMFYNTSLESFSSDLSNLTDGRYMFSWVDSLTSFDGDLSSLENGSHMFYNTSLESFSSDLSNLTDGCNMFYNTSLASFSSDLSNLTDGRYMFQKCFELISFGSNLNNLQGGLGMFEYCKLDPASVKNILNTITYSISTRILTIGINIPRTDSDADIKLNAFANEVGYDTWEDLKEAFTAKNWIVSFNWAGSQDTITLLEDEQLPSVPIYAKLIEEKEPEKAEYCTEDGTKYYNIFWGHDVNKYDEFQHFGSLQEACGYWGIIPKKYLETA